MLPSKGRRNINVDGVEWHYVVNPSSARYGFYAVTANNPENGETIIWSYRYGDDIEITPSLVVDIIRTKGKPEAFSVIKPKKYITTTLPYANSVPHIGHAFEFIIVNSVVV